MSSKVYASRTDDRTGFTGKVLGIFSGELRGRKIFVKPNVVSWEGYPTTTHPEVLRVVLEQLVNLGCEILVGDGPAVDAGDAAEIIGNHPLAAVCKEAGFELLNLHEHGFEKVKAKSGFSLQVSKPPLGCDFVVSLPILKSHPICDMTGALKNHFGFLRNRGRVLMHSRLKNIDRGIAELNNIFPSLTVMDAVESYRNANERRHGGVWVSIGYLLAGKDPVALDSFGLELLKKVEPRLKNKKPRDIEQIRHAVETGVGSEEYQEVSL